MSMLMLLDFKFISSFNEYIEYLVHLCLSTIHLMKIYSFALKLLAKTADFREAKPAQTLKIYTNPCSKSAPLRL